MTLPENRRAFLAKAGTGALLTGAIGLHASVDPAWGERSKDQTPDMPWQRRAQPALSSTSARLDWCETYCYSPHVIRTPDGYRMYFIGRTGDSFQTQSLMKFVIGMATSDDGLNCVRTADAVCALGQTGTALQAVVHWDHGMGQAARRRRNGDNPATGLRDECRRHTLGRASSAGLRIGPAAVCP
jgi:hypothetical protein